MYHYKLLVYGVMTSLNIHLQNSTLHNALYVKYIPLTGSQLCIQMQPYLLEVVNTCGCSVLRQGQPVSWLQVWCMAQ